MKKIIIYTLFLIEIIIFSGWFRSGTLSSGDWNYRYINLESYILFTSWSNTFGNSLGGNDVILLALNTYYVNTGYFIHSFIGLPWEAVERILWYFPFLIFSFFSIRYLYKKIFPLHSEMYATIASFFYLTNSYILMVVGGGQIAIGMSIAFAPFVIGKFYDIFYSFGHKQLLNRNILYRSILAGIILSLQLLFDIRFTYITLAAICILCLLFITFTKNKKLFIIYSLLVPSSVTLLLHAFWLIPLMIGGENPLHELGASYISIESLKFFSVAKIENTIGLMHPYWPENIFGKVGFMKPEFLIYPILAFSSLLFIPQKKSYERKIILYFVLIALIGIFLAKGSNDPFGILYVWLFEHFPGFSMFRDPTKWYTLIALSYSILIPYSLFTIQRFIRNKYQSKVYKDIFLLLMIFLLVFPIRAAVMGELSGTFKPQLVPQEYKTLSNFLHSQPDYFRTLWIPTSSNLAYSTYNHPRMAGGDFLKESDTKKLTNKLAKNEKIIKEASIKYVIIPYATRGEIFQTERKYDPKLYESTINAVRTIPWLKEKEGFGNVKVFQVADYKPHIWRQNDSENNVNSITFINPTHYDAAIYNGKKGDTVIFSESYDPKWYMQTPYGTVFSKKYGMLNSFQLPEDGTYEVSLLYAPQKYVIWGTWISAISLVIVLSSIIYLKRKI